MCHCVSVNVDYDAPLVLLDVKLYCKYLLRSHETLVSIAELIVHCVSCGSIYSESSLSVLTAIFQVDPG